MVTNINTDTYNKCIVAEDITFSHIAVSLEQLEHGFTCCVHGNIAHKYLCRHCVSTNYKHFTYATNKKTTSVQRVHAFNNNNNNKVYLYMAPKSKRQWAL